MNIIVKISDGANSHTEDVTQGLEEYFNELQDNGYNPHLKGKTFKWWTRPVKLKTSDVDFGNTKANAHFIFDWMDNFIQSTTIDWAQVAADLEIEVGNYYPEQYNPKKLIISEDILFYAFRYCLGRMTGAVSECVQSLIFNWDNLKPHTQGMIHSEIREAIVNQQGGMDCDVKEWGKILKLEVRRGE